MIKCIDYKDINKGSLMGSATLKIIELDLDIKNITLLQKDGKRWVNFPSRTYESKGETKRTYDIWIENPEKRKKFQEVAKAAIDAYLGNTGTLDEGNKEELPF